MTQKTEIVTHKQESSQLEEMRKQHEMKLQERQRLEMMISQESKVVTGQVAKRSDDVHGLGWGNVTTGFVSRKKLGFLQRGTESMERDWSAEGSPAPGVRRVTWADSQSPGSASRPDSRLQDVDTLRAQTPPLAGEWAMEKKANQQSSMTFSNQQSSSSSAAAFQASQSAAFSSSNQMSSTFSSSQKSSFSQSASSSFQSSSIEASKAFEAFPGMNTIENLKLEQ